MLIIYRILRNPGSLLYRKFTNPNYRFTADTVHTVGICQTLDNPPRQITPEQSAAAINLIVETFQNNIEDIKKGNIIDLQSFLEILNHCPNKMLGENFFDGLYHDSSEMLYSIIQLFNIDTSEGHKNEYYFSWNNQKLERYLTQNNFYFDFMIDGHRDALGQLIYDRKKSDYKSSDIQIASIKHTELSKLDRASSPYNTSVFIRTKVLHNTTENPVKTYSLDDGYEIIGMDGEHATSYMKIDSHDSPKPMEVLDQYTSDNPANPPGFRVKYKIEENVLNNLTEDIFIILNRADTARVSDKTRKDRLKKAQETFNNIEIIPEEEIQIETSQYQLYGAVVWHNGHYISFFRCNDEYYFYNDMNTENYIQKVGSYEQLLGFRYSDTPNVIKTNSTIFYYIRK